MNVSTDNLRFDVAMARQRFAGRAADQGAFDRAMRGAAGSEAGRSDHEQIDRRLNEAVAVSFIAPLLADAMGGDERTYFTNSRAEQAYARQMYMEIATRIGQSNRLPLGRSIAESFKKRIEG